MSFSIEPDAHYALFKTEEFGELQTHIVIDLRISRDLDRLVSSLEAARLPTSTNVVITKFHATLPSDVGSALEDMGLLMALDNYGLSDELDEGSEEAHPYKGADLFSGADLAGIVEHEMDDVVVLKGSQLLEIFDGDPDLVTDDDDDDEVELGITLIPVNGDFVIQPVLTVASESVQLDVKSAARLPWSEVRRRFLELSE